MKRTAAIGLAGLLMVVQLSFGASAHAADEITLGFRNYSGPWPYERGPTHAVGSVLEENPVLQAVEIPLDGHKAAIGIKGDLDAYVPLDACCLQAVTLINGHVTSDWGFGGLSSDNTYLFSYGGYVPPGTPPEDAYEVIPTTADPTQPLGGTYLTVQLYQNTVGGPITNGTLLKTFDVPLAVFLDAPSATERTQRVGGNRSLARSRVARVRYFPAFAGRFTRVVSRKEHVVARKALGLKGPGLRATSFLCGKKRGIFKIWINGLAASDATQTSRVTNVRC